MRKMLNVALYYSFLFQSSLGLDSKNYKKFLVVSFRHFHVFDVFAERTATLVSIRTIICHKANLKKLTQKEGVLIV